MRGPQSIGKHLTVDDPLPEEWSFANVQYEALKTVAAAGVLVSAAGGNDGDLANDMGGYYSTPPVLNNAREHAPCRARQRAASANISRKLAAGAARG